MIKDNYYAQKLNAQNLYRVYDTGISRVKQYLDSEISFVRGDLTGKERVLELGAGYGRIMKELSDDCRTIVGIDISEENVSSGVEYLRGKLNAEIICMDVGDLSFDEKFDIVLCLQNGLSSMRIESSGSVEKIMDLVEDGGRAYFSTYSDKFWKYRLMWFQEQAHKGLLGEIDMDKTGDGIIVCKDGFKAITHTPEDLKRIGVSSGYEYSIREVDESSVFLVIHKKKKQEDDH